ncbi:glyceraldehyde-3-phosphate dehydrogenase [Zhihengliuella salsuginis]|uniref:Glyceraldehyde-3-phosphate dehydrogenase n=1 Tax=Zhihengliuella salsuginis TaxID=578222 RepID=A0ABQ3GCK8_9MICC|nr:glyceraldehyde-3-phosphate dehydrogenase [Zhihengliuella salsuginis]GHD01721.1 glyceraldehyde-3-phosphate dehydrogenase [Zhihengliuella salsuginis]
MTQQSAAALSEWSGREELAEAMIPLIGRLYRKNNVVTSIYGRKLINKSAVDILKAHRIARHNDGRELPLEETYPLLLAIDGLNLGASSIDLAKLTRKYKETGDGAELSDFLKAEFGDIVGSAGASEAEPRDVVLYGFGRIGRLLARILIERGGYGLRLRAIVVRKGSETDLVKRASLLRRDSVHGPFDGSITVDKENNTIQANGTLIKVIYSSDPSAVDYTEYGIDNAIVVDNTGKWRDREGLEQHLQSKGVARVLLTAPGKGDVKNIVHGINHGDITDDDKVVSAASCTTNAITPVLKALNDEYGVVHGHVETVHSFTNDQNLIDNFHKGDRRGRSAALNMVLTETGAAKAVSTALPEFEGKLTGNAIRVPTPDVSMAILNLNLEKDATKEDVNTYLRQTSLNSALHKQIDYIDSPEVVSTDFIGSRRAGIVDGLATIANGKNAVVYVWYDNEFGYSCQVIRVVEELAGTHPRAFPVVDAEVAVAL